MKQQFIDMKKAEQLRIFIRIFLIVIYKTLFTKGESRGRNRTLEKITLEINAAMENTIWYPEWLGS